MGSMLHISMWASNAEDIIRECEALMLIFKGTTPDLFSTKNEFK